MNDAAYDQGAIKALSLDRPRSAELNDLYRRYRRELIAFVRTKVGAGPPEPDDVMQQVFLQYALLDEPERIENPSAFLYRTATNIVINYRRRDVVIRRHFQTEVRDNEIFGERDGLNPEIVLLNKEQFAAVAVAVRKMPRRRRRFLLLHRIEGLTYAEIARRAGLSGAVVRKQVALAVRECASALPADPIAEEKTETEADE